MMLVACIIILTALILGFLFLIYKKTVTSHQAYQQMHKKEKSRGMQPLKKMKALAPNAQPSEEKRNLMNEEASPTTNNYEEHDGADDGYL